MQEEKNSVLVLPSFRVCWGRLQEATDIIKQSQLAVLVGKTEAYISKLKKKDIFLPEWAYYVSLKYDVSMDWIIKGDGKPKDNKRESQKRYDFSILEELNDWLSEIVLEEPYRKDWFLASIEDSFPMFRDWRKQKNNNDIAK